MDDRTLINTGMAYSEKTIETVDDVIKALLAVLSEKSMEEHRHVLENMAKYVQSGGELHATQFSAEHLQDFEKEAQKNGLAYYAITDARNNKITVIVKDCDTFQFEYATAKLAEKGILLYKDPQIYVAEFLEKYAGRNIAFSQIESESLKKVKSIKKGAIGEKIEFAIGKRQDNSHIVVYLCENHKTLVELGIIDGNSSPSLLFNSVDIQEVKEVVKQKKTKEMEKEKEKTIPRTR